jgi:hypothetical protein
VTDGCMHMRSSARVQAQRMRMRPEFTRAGP